MNYLLKNLVIESLGEIRWSPRVKARLMLTSTMAIKPTTFFMNQLLIN